MKGLEDLAQLLDECKKNNALIHCITHSININDMANVILALNQSPIMADHNEEVEGVTKNARALLLNPGNLQEHRRKSMEISARVALNKGIAMVMDLVGIGVSTIRINLMEKVLKEVSKYKDVNKAGIIVKGNYSEILCLLERSKKTRGVDNEDDDIKKVEEACRDLSNNYGVVFLATGKKDLVVYRDRTLIVNNGHVFLSKITGTGCMAGAICAALLAYTKDGFKAGALAMTLLGIAGERAAKRSPGPSSFHINLLDEIYMITGEDIIKEGNISGL